MKSLDIVVIMGPGSDRGVLGAVAALTPPALGAPRAVDAAQSAFPSDALDALVVLDARAQLMPDWYLPVLVTTDHDRDSVITPPIASGSGGASAAHRSLIDTPRGRRMFLEHLASGRRPLTPPSTPDRGDKVTVLVPTFNRHALLRRALECLVAQTYQPLEVVVVNDAGLDPTAVVAPFADRLDVRLVHQPANLGRSSTYNRGLAEATGRWVTFLADDDILPPEHIATLVGAAAPHGGPVLTYGPTSMVQEDDDGNELRRDVWLDGQRSREYLLVENFVFGEAAIFDRQVALDVGGFDTRLEVLEDWEFWIRMSRQSPLVHIPIPTSQYRMRATTIGNSYVTCGPAKFFDHQQRIYDRYPVAEGSWTDKARQIKLQALRPMQEGVHAFEQTIGVVGNGDLDALVRCVNSIVEKAGPGPTQLIIHEVRSPEAEQLLAPLAGVIICLSEIYDPELAMNRIVQQAGGRRVMVLSSAEQLTG